MRTRHITAPLAALLAMLGLAGTTLAHHSFAVFFDEQKRVEVSGTVTEFLFRNPHGVIRIEVTGKDGKKEVWRAETNSPSILERRGWTRTSLKPGDEITIEGWPARDGSNYLRMRKVTRADGTPVGVPFESVDQK
jgi:hypothetical protein